MIDRIVTKIFGTKHQRDVNKIKPLVEEIHGHVERFRHLSDEDLRGKTRDFQNRIEAHVGHVRAEIQSLKNQLQNLSIQTDEELNLETIRGEIDRLEEEELALSDEILDELLPEAFATVQETCRRMMGKSWKVCDQDITWGMVPFDVQLIGAIVLHQGKIAEMATGEGKTLVATMPLYLNALTGRGVHLVTVNDYLARRDREWMGPIYEFLGLTVGCIQNEMNPEQRKREYGCDITYGTNNEFGFDYLRDNMAVRAEDRVQRGHHYAIVDEVDSVLIDEARTPLIISGPVSESTHHFREMKPMVEKLVRSQSRLVNEIVVRADRLLKDGQEYEAGIELLRAHRGSPKHNRLTKLLHEPGTKKLMTRVEMDYMRDKRMGEIDEELYYSIDERGNTIDLTEKGRETLSPRDPEFFVLPDLAEELSRIEGDESLSSEERGKQHQNVHKIYAERSEKIHNIQQLLKAYSLFEKDVEYVVDQGRVMIVDEFTGRLMPGRRYSDGLHEAIEAKEGVTIERETQTLATITLQNYFRLYDKLAGMTGTAETEAPEFYEIYKLDVVVIPTNESIRRPDYEDRIFRTRREKYNAVVNEIEEWHRIGRPILVGTVSVEVSETLSRMLKRKGILHSVLNAKHHQKEAEIIAHAGERGSVTLATNMAGRGTDIKLGPGVVKHPNCALVDPNPGEEVCPYLNEYRCHERVPCGLHIIGTERHEARRIDRQLRGRSGRQGDPGSSRFYLSLEDDLMRLFGSERISGVMDRLGIEDGDVITHPMVTRAIERAQKRVEAYNFDIRKHLLEYDDVMNQQRTVIYDLRGHALEGEDLREEYQTMLRDVVAQKVFQYAGDEHPDQWDLNGLREDVGRTLLVTVPLSGEERSSLKSEDLQEQIETLAQDYYTQKEKALEPEMMRQLERMAMLKVIDERWKEHLYEMDQLKEGIGLRAYGQKNPLIEYKQEGYRMFVDLLDRIHEEAVSLVFKAQLVREPVPDSRLGRTPLRAVHDTGEGLSYRRSPVPAELHRREAEMPRIGKREPVRVGQKVGRNDPCPCGSGKKYKKCCGR
ncbi:MAG: preprotein translocase subunit SecA [Gemmatimonadota bacterium]|nr:MAG: preprotein translocase subunit SecA [Gemmatimonadota bacterium]